jgi:hypothetical protein
LKPYTATVTAGPAGLGTLVKLLLIVSVTIASSLIFVSPNGRIEEHPTNDAIANGADVEAVMKRLRDSGYDITTKDLNPEWVKQNQKK